MEPQFASLYDEYETDLSAAETEGTWVSFKAGVQIKLLSEQSTAARKWAHARTRKLRSVIMANDGVLPPHVSDAVDIDLLAEVLIKDWRGVYTRDRVPVPCTREAIKQLMTQLPALRREVLTAARMDETFKKAALEALEGNSSPSSAPNSSPADG